MARHTSSRHNKKNSVTTWLPAYQENNSHYQALHYWVSVMVGLLSLSLLLQRFRGAMPAYAVSPSFTTVMQPYDNRQSSYEIQFPSLAPLLLGSALTYQSGNSAIGLLGSLPLWVATSVAGQTPDVKTVVPEFLVNSNTTGNQYAPAVASLSSGEWVVAWQGWHSTGTDIYAQRYAMNGSVLGSEFRVNSNVTGYQFNPAVASLSTGEWVVVWRGDQTGDFDIYAQRYAVNGSVLGSEFRVNSVTTREQQAPAVASLSTGEWVVVWAGSQTGELDIYAQRYAMNGSLLGSEFRVNSARSGWQYIPAVASLSTAEWVVAWVGDRSGNDIYAQQLAANGSLLRSELSVNSNVTASQYTPAVASLSTGDWVVVWWGSQTGDLDIYAQRYAVNGSVLGTEFRVNSATAGNQQDPAVASLITGEWVVVWSGNQTGNWDIYAQRYAMNGSVLGSEFRVNSNVTGSQSSPAVASLSPGEWVVMWQGDQTGSVHIYGSIFSSTGPLSMALSSTSMSTADSTLPSALTMSTSSTSSLPLPIITDNLATSTLPSTMTGQGSSSLSSSLSTTPQDNAAKTPAMKSSLNLFTSASSGVSGTVTTATNKPSTTSPQAIATNANSGISGVVIGAAVGGSVVGIAACLGVLGFYAYRKKSRVGQANPSAVSEVGTSLKAIEQTSAQPASEYAQVNLKDSDQSDNMIPVSHSPYGRIDEMKKQEKEYDNAPSF